MLRRLARPALAVAGLATLVVALPSVRAQAPPGAQRLCEGGSDAVLRDGRWTTVRKPEELSRITAHAAGGAGERLLLASDGRTIMRSTDGGCSWTAAHEVQAAAPGSPAEGALPRVTALLVPEGGERAFAVVQGPGGAAGSQLLASDGGAFEPVEGLPAVTGFRDLVSAPDDPSVMYLWTGVAEAAGDVDPAGATGQVWASRDGGATWSQASTGPQVERLAVDPVDAKDVWAVRSNGTVAMSTDHGATWAPIAMPEPHEGHPPVTGDRWLDIAHFRRLPLTYATVVFAAPSRAADVTRAVVSFDQGKSWQELSVDGLGPAGGLMFGNDQSQVFAAAGSSASSWRGPGFREFVVEEDRWRNADDFGLVSLLDPQPARYQGPAGPERAIWMRRDHPLPDGGADLLARFQPPPAGPKDYGLTGRPKCGATGGAGVPARRVRFTPEGLDLRLEPGQPARADIEARLDAEPTPVDTFFLLDHSSSTDPAVSGLNCSITRLVTDLPESNFDMFFGLGGYNDIVTYTYRRLADLLPAREAGPVIAEELRRLNTLRGAQEPLRGALFQAATGAGLDVRVSDAPFSGAGPAGGGRVHRRVDPGQHVSWRDGVLRTVVVITDEPYVEDTEGEPAYSEVIAALKAKDVKVIGLPWEPPVKPEDANPSSDHSTVKRLQLRQQLSAIARDTGAIAPRGGVDCDGGGSPDVPEGEPIVCPLPQSGLREELDDTLVSVLRSLTDADVQPVRLVPRAGGLSVTLEGPAPEPRDVRAPSSVAQTAVLSCSEEQAGRRFEVAFDLEVGGKVVETLKGAARCGDAPAAVVPPVRPKRAAPKDPPARPAAERPAPAEPPVQPQPAPATPPQPQPAAVGAPPPAPPAPAPVSSVPAQAPAAAQAVAPNPGAAAQDEPEVAVKAATVSTADGEGGPSAARDYAMVAASPRSAVPLPALVTLGVGLSGLLVYVGAATARRRRQVRPALVRVRR